MPPSRVTTFIKYVPADFAGLTNVICVDDTTELTDTSMLFIYTWAPAEKFEPCNVIVCPPAVLAEDPDW